MTQTIQENNNQKDSSPQGREKKSLKWIITALGGLIAGIVIAMILMFTTMPSMMINVKESRYGFDETVSKIEQGIDDIGWSSSGTMFINKSLEKHGVEFAPRVKIIKLCQPDYAKQILTTDRYISCMMPCSISVWENDNGKTFISKMNTGLMGKMFGGKIAEIMGGKVSHDEHQLLKGIVK